MSGARFVTCPQCRRLMLGQRNGADIYPQPHACIKTTEDAK